MNIDGTEIFVEKLPGAGDLNFVLIHNAGSDHRFFIHQIEMLGCSRSARASQCNDCSVSKNLCEFGKNEVDGSIEFFF